MPKIDIRDIRKVGDEAFADMVLANNCALKGKDALAKYIYDRGQAKYEYAAELYVKLCERRKETINAKD